MSLPAATQIIALLAADKLFEPRVEFLKNSFPNYSILACSTAKQVQKLATDKTMVVIAHLNDDFAVVELLEELNSTNIYSLIGLSDEQHDIVEAMQNGYSDVVMFNNLTHLQLVIERELSATAARGSINAKYALPQYSDFTGVYSRLEFLQHIAQISCDDLGKSSAIIYLQLDNFAWINENIGMTAADTYLRDIGKLLLNILSKSDFPARYQGGNFIILLNASEQAELKSKSDMIRESILELSTEYNDNLISSTASIGVRQFETNSKLIDLITHAFDASDVARTSGGDTIHYYQPDKDESDEHRNNRDWNTRIKKAFDKDLFVLYFQPIVSIKADSEPRYEVLLRMQDESGNIISPGTFLPFAERAGLMSDIDRKVIVSSIEQSQAQQSEHLPQLFIKLSGKSVDDKSMPSWIANTLADYDCPPERLVFEITESIALHHLVQTRNLCSKLKEIGCKVALDHFGTRFRSFKLLQSLQIDYIKIDGSLIQHLVDNKSHQVIVNKIVTIAKKNEIELIAESVQEAAFLPIIWQFDIPYVQGYFLGVPNEKMDYDFRNLLI